MERKSFFASAFCFTELAFSAEKKKNKHKMERNVEIFVNCDRCCFSFAPTMTEIRIKNPMF